MSTLFFTRISFCLLFFSLLSPSFVRADTIVVMNTNDSGPGSLRQAVADAVDGDLIQFAAATNKSTIFLTSGELMINVSVRIEGNGMANTLISGNNNSRIFNISGADSVSISRLRLAQGRTMESGGAILIVNSRVQINDCFISGNRAGGAAATQGGGGIANDGGRLTIRNSRISDNMADGAAGSGGGILNLNGGELSIVGGSISRNSASRAGGGIEDNSGEGSMVLLNDVRINFNTTGNNPGNGGGVHITGPGNMSISGVKVIGNKAAAEGGGLWNGSGTMTVDRSVISNNTASGAMADQGGGGVFNAGGSVMIRNNTSITFNVADGASGSGGGILNDAGGMLSMEGGIIARNTAKRAGGGIEDNSGAETTVMLRGVMIDFNSTGSSPGNGGGVHITGPGNMTIRGGSVNFNKASAEGGGLWNGSGTMTIDSVTISRNTAGGAAADQGGGGVFNNGGTLAIRNSVIRNNVADGASGSGGGILNDAGGALTVMNTTISKNTATRAGGGIEDNSGAATMVELTDVVLEFNSTGASPGNGGGVHITGPGNMTITGGRVSYNKAAAEGGGLWNGSGAMIIDSVTITRNTASGAMADQGGGGVFNAGGTVMIRNGTLVSNNVADGASGSGGGILNDAGGMLAVMNSSILANTAKRAGGGIEDNSGNSTTVVLVDVVLERNSTGDSPGNGGAIHITGPGNMTISGGRINNNTAAREGGGLWNGSGLMSVENATIDGNTAGGPAADDGGGGVFNNGGSLEITASTISNNTATGEEGNGGGVHNAGGGDATITYSTISGNRANGNGGGIFNNGMLSLKANTITNNTAGGEGGGIAQDTAAIATDVQGSIVAGNTSSGAAPDMMNGSESIVSNGYNIIGQDDSGYFTETGDTTGTAGDPIDMLLGPLADNGGATRTHSLLCGSPAIDAGDPGDTSNDQRGLPVFGSSRDIGAFERQDACSESPLVVEGRHEHAPVPVVANNPVLASRLYPNPSFTGMVSLEIPAGFEEEMELRINDLAGRQLFRQVLTVGTTQLNLSSLPAGTYLIQIVSGERVELHKWVLSK